jgi:hypothetical protein
MSLENTLREMLSEQNRPGPGIGAFGQTPIRNPPKEVDLSKGPYVNPPKPKPRPGVDFTPERKPGNPTRKGIKEFYKARLQGALLGESKARKLARGEAHEMPALWGARREAIGDALSGFAKGAAVGGLASVLGIAASGSVLPPPDVATHNARVAAGEVVPPKGVSIGQVRATAEPLPAYRAFQRAAEAARAKGNEGK